jgi:hypothetical protein
VAILVIAELALMAAFASTPAAPPRAPHLPRVHAAIVIDRDPWTNTITGATDVGIPAWFASEGDRKLHVRPETRRAALGRCGARARALARFVLWHEAGHAAGADGSKAGERAANAYAYEHVGPRLEALLPAYGTLLTTWRELRLRCMEGDS